MKYNLFKYLTLKIIKSNNFDILIKIKIINFNKDNKYLTLKYFIFLR